MGDAESAAGIKHAAAGVTPPRYEHESYNEDLYEWTERGVENPHDVSWSPVFYTCKFCPARGDTPDEVSHSTSCPVNRAVEADTGQSVEVDG